MKTGLSPTPVLVIATLALAVGFAWFNRRVGTVIDEAFGDWPAMPAAIEKGMEG